jgi:hypothetical protein
MHWPPVTCHVTCHKRNANLAGQLYLCAFLAMRVSMVACGVVWGSFRCCNISRLHTLLSTTMVVAHKCGTCRCVVSMCVSAPAGLHIYVFESQWSVSNGCGCCLASRCGTARLCHRLWHCHLALQNSVLLLAEQSRPDLTVADVKQCGFSWHRAASCAKQQ